MSIGGAGKSFLKMIEGLQASDQYQIDRLLIGIEKKLRKIYNLYGIGYYTLIPKIMKSIRKNKPQIILVQTGLALPTIIAGYLTKVPVINMIRDPVLICPKNVDIFNYGTACKGLINKKTCDDCINRWRTLREIIGNKPPKWRFTLKSILTTIGYKARYYVSRFNLYLFNYATINIVACNLMKSILSSNLNPNKIKVMNITPIMRKDIPKDLKKENNILFLIPKSDPSPKGLEFVLRLSKRIPANYKILIVGKILPKLKTAKYNTKILNIERVSGKDLDKLYQTAKLTLMPTFATEPFGRVIPESILNNTPVISAPHCGANEFFQNKDFVKIVPLKQNLWAKAIKEMIENIPIISNSDIKRILNQFSIEKCINDFTLLVNRLKK